MKKNIDRQEFVRLLREMHNHSIDLDNFIVNYVRNKTLFEFLIAVLLSQNTNEKNAIKAYKNLKNLINNITPDNILKTELRKISEAIKPAGMYNERAKRFYEIAKLFKDKDFTSKLHNIIKNSDVEKARRFLTSIPGVGKKTADVILLMYFNKPTFPVDTHIARITYRLGFVDRKDYDAVRSFWMNFLRREDYLEVHLLLITHGRKICRSRNPLCSKCLLIKYCSYGKKLEK